MFANALNALRLVYGTYYERLGIELGREPFDSSNNVVTVIMFAMSSIQICIHSMKRCSVAIV